jgi:hypothetical protein
MTIIENCKDMVISYVVFPGGTDNSDKTRLGEFLKAGYRVLDVIAMPSNGNSSTVAVTVILTFLSDEEGRQIYYQSGKK